MSVLIIFLKPFFIIRILPVKTRFGQMVSEKSHYAAIKQSGLLKESIEFFYFSESGLFNTFLMTVYRRQYNIINPHVARYTKKILGKRNDIGWKGIKHHFDLDLNGVLNKTYPNIIFSDDELEAGKLFLNKFTIDCKGIVCLSLKVKSYYDQHKLFSDYPMSENEFADIDNYIDAVNLLTQKGYLVLRMGGTSKSKQLSLENKLYYDYSTSTDKSDFLDVYLASCCSFILSNQTGYDMLGIAFRKPIYTTNSRSFQYEIINYPFTLMLPRKYKSESLGRHLTFLEMFEIEKKVFTNGHYAHAVNKMNEMGVYFEKESSSDITQFTLETILYHNGKLILSDHDKILQNKLWQLYLDANFDYFYTYKKPDEIYLKVSPQFLRENEWMLA